MAQLLDLRALAAGKLPEHLLPARVRHRPGGLRDVAEDRERAEGAARDHADLHRREVLRLVHDHVAVADGLAEEQSASLVQQREVSGAPAGTGAPQQPLLALVQDPLGGLREPLARREELAYEPL